MARKCRFIRTFSSHINDSTLRIYGPADEILVLIASASSQSPVQPVHLLCSRLAYTNYGQTKINPYCSENDCFLCLLHIQIHFRLDFIMEANTMKPNQTDPLRTVCSGSILFAISATKEHK